jgi:hypothetical protein
MKRNGCRHAVREICCPHALFIDLTCPRSATPCVQAPPPGRHSVDESNVSATSFETIPIHPAAAAQTVVGAIATAAGILTRDVRAPQEPPDDWTIALSVLIRTVTKLVHTKPGLIPNKLGYNMFQDRGRNIVDCGAQMPSPTVRRLSQQLLSELPAQQLRAFQHQIQWF